MIFHPTEINFAIEISKDDFLTLMDIESLGEDTLLYRLEKIEGVSDIDYDGHFGPYIYLKMNLDISIRDMTEKIKKEIKKFLDKGIHV